MYVPAPEDYSKSGGLGVKFVHLRLSWCGGRLERDGVSRDSGAGRMCDGMKLEKVSHGLSGLTHGSVKIVWLGREDSLCAE